MLPNYDIKPGLLQNEDKFKHPFFEQFTLRHAPVPLELNESVSKNYLFPTCYSDVTCAQAIFFCNYDAAQALLPHPKMKPVRMTYDRAIVAFSCYIYTNVMGVAPYNEIAMTIPIMVDPKVDAPVLPLVTKFFKEFGYYVFSMPVTSLENRTRGHKIWGLPKEVQEIDIFEDGGDCVTVAKEENGDQYFELRVPMKGKKTRFDEKAFLYSKLNGELLQSQTCFKADFRVNANFDTLLKKGVPSDRPYLTVGDTPCGRVIKDLGVEEKPFQLRFAKHMNACFDLPNADFVSPITF